MSKHFNLTKIKQLTYHLLTTLTLVSQCWSIDVFLIEDDLGKREIYKRILKKEGFKVFTAIDGVEYIDIVRVLSFDAIVTASDITGSAFYRKFIENPKGIYKFDPIKTILVAHTMDEINSDLTDQFPSQVKLVREDNDMKEITKLIGKHEDYKLNQNHPDEPHP